MSENEENPSLNFRETGLQISYKFQTMQTLEGELKGKKDFQRRKFHESGGEISIEDIGYSPKAGEVREMGVWFTVNSEDNLLNKNLIGASILWEIQQDAPGVLSGLVEKLNSYKQTLQLDAEKSQLLDWSIKQLARIADPVEPIPEVLKSYLERQRGRW